MTDVGIIGARRLGKPMARTALRADRSVVMANSRGPESLGSVVLTLGEGVSAGTVDHSGPHVPARTGAPARATRSRGCSAVLTQVG